MAEPRLRTTVSAPGLLRVVRHSFDEVHDPVPNRRFSLSDCLLKSLDMRFILEATPADHTALFAWVEATERMHPGAVQHIEHTDEQGVRHRFRFLNADPLNDTHFALEVNFLEYWETRPNGKTQRFSWVTDLPIDDTHVMALMRAARARCFSTSSSPTGKPCTGRLPSGIARRGPSSWTRRESVRRGRVGNEQGLQGDEAAAIETARHRVRGALACHGCRPPIRPPQPATPSHQTRQRESLLVGHLEVPSSVHLSQVLAASRKGATCLVGPRHSLARGIAAPGAGPGWRTPAVAREATGRAPGRRRRTGP